VGNTTLPLLYQRKGLRDFATNITLSVFACLN
jgi:hypothetical protein